MSVPQKKYSEAGSRPPAEISTQLAWLIVVVAVLALVFIRFSGPPDLMENDQNMPTAYILDAVVNGNWVCQHDDGGVIISKPPLYYWLAGAGMAASGEINTFWIYLPDSLAMAGIAALLLVAGEKIWSVRVGMFAALAFLFCHLAVKHMALVRTDSVFAFTVALTAWFAYGAWARGWNWTWFWLACALTTLTKGPLGILLAGFGFFVAAWERDAGGFKRGKKFHLIGVALFVLLACGWWWLAYAQFGDELTQEMIRNELVHHAVSTDASHTFWRGLPKPTGYFFSRFVPWILFTVAAMWRVCRAPAADKAQRTCERFAFCWLVGGWVLFSIVPHHRPDFILPLLPAAALLAGVELARLLRNVPTRTVLKGTAAVMVVGVAAVELYYGDLRPHPVLTQQTIGMRELGGEIHAAVGYGFPLTQVDSPAALQFYARTMWTDVPAARAATLLRGAAAAYVAVEDYAALNAAAGEFYDVAQWPTNGAPFLRIVSNRPKLEKLPTMAFCDGPFRVTMLNTTLLRKEQVTYKFTTTNRDFAVEVANESQRARLVSVEVAGLARPISRSATLKAGEKLRVTAE